MIGVEIRLRPARDGGGAGYGGVEWQRARDVAIGVHGGGDASHDRNVEIEGFVDEAELVDQQALRTGVTNHTSHVTHHTSHCNTSHVTCMSAASCPGPSAMSSICP